MTTSIKLSALPVQTASQSNTACDLDGTDLCTLSSSVGGGKEVAIQAIKKASQEQATLLDLSGMSITWLPGCVGKIKSLKEIYLDRNDLLFLPDELGQLHNLVVISFNYNRRLDTLPGSLRRIPTLQALLNGGSGVSDRECNEILSQTRSITIVEIKRENLEKSNLLFSGRPRKVQEEIDKVYATLSKHDTPNHWGHAGNHGFYNLLNFEDSDVIAQRIEKAPPGKKDLYFIDLGAGNFQWVDQVESYLRREYNNDKHHFHVIGTTGEGDPYDCTRVDGNITTHKITGFKLENLLESFEKLNLKLDNSVEFIVMSWVLQHLLDPIGDLDQAYHLLSPGNGFLFGTGFYPYQSLTEPLSLAFGFDHFIGRKMDGKLDHFGLFRSQELPYSFAKDNLEYDQTHPIRELPSFGYDSFACKYANLNPKKYRPPVQSDFGGLFYGLNTNVLEQLLGNGEKTFKYKGDIIKKPLFQDGYTYLTLYLDSYRLSYETDRSISITEALRRASLL